MEIKCSYISLTNHEQVEWWNKVGRKLAKAHLVDKMVETATGKTVGLIVHLTGLLSKFVEYKLGSFHKDSVAVRFEIE